MRREFNRESFDPATYRAYLVRLWQEGSRNVWRASVQSAESGTIARFASLDALFDFLLSETEESEHGDHTSTAQK